MRHLICILIAFAFYQARSQTVAGILWRMSRYTAPLAVMNGITDANAEIMEQKPQLFLAKFPKANPQFWNERLAWRNKHKNGDPAQGPAFPFSRNALVWATSGRKLNRMIGRISRATQVAIPFVEGRDDPFYYFAAGVVINLGTEATAFELTYHKFYKG